MAAAKSGGGYRQPLKLPGFSGQNFAYRGVTPKRGNGLTTRLSLSGQDFAGFGATASDDANAAKLLPAGTRIFSEGAAGDTTTAARATITSIDVTTALMQIDFIVHPEALSKLTIIRLYCIDSAGKYIRWTVWNPLTGLSPSGSGRFRMSVSMASVGGMQVGFDPTDVTKIQVEAALSETIAAPIFSVCRFKMVDPPADGKARLLLTIDDNHQTIVSALHAAADAGVFATLFPICRLLDDGSADTTYDAYGGYHGWGDLAALRDRGHRIGNHSCDHHTTYWQENGDRMMYDIQAAQERLAEMVEYFPRKKIKLPYESIMRATYVLHTKDDNT
jgi:hypothetical protein